MSKYTSIAARVAVSVAALWIVFVKIDLAQVGEAIVALNPGWLLAAIGAVYAAIAVSVAKWWLLVHARGHRVNPARLTRHYFVGFFFNNFLPTSVGGDVVRAWDLGADLGDAAEGAATVIAERLIASLALGITALIGLALSDAARVAAIPVAVVVIVSMALFGAFLLPSRSASVVRSAMGGRFETATDWIERAVHAVNALLRNAPVLLGVLGLSVLFQVLVAAVNYCTLTGLGAPVTMADAIVFTSIISAVTMVPISISGHGIREAGYAYFFGLVGVGQSSAITSSLLFFALVALCTLPGAALFLQGRRSVHRVATSEGATVGADVAAGP